MPLTSPVVAVYAARMKNTSGKPQVNALIIKAIERHVDLPTAEKLFGELSKVGGNAFRERMGRVKRIVQQRQKEKS
jgi:hypothetical protein